MRRFFFSLISVLFLAPFVSAQDQMLSCETRSRGNVFRLEDLTSANPGNSVLTACLDHKQTRDNECQRNLKCYVSQNRGESRNPSRAQPPGYDRSGGYSRGAFQCDLLGVNNSLVTGNDLEELQRRTLRNYGDDERGQLLLRCARAGSALQHVYTSHSCKVFDSTSLSTDLSVAQNEAFNYCEKNASIPTNTSRRVFCSARMQCDNALSYRQLSRCEIKGEGFVLSTTDLSIENAARALTTICERDGRFSSGLCHARATCYSIPNSASVDLAARIERDSAPVRTQAPVVAVPAPVVPIVRAPAPTPAAPPAVAAPNAPITNIPPVTKPAGPPAKATPAVIVDGVIITPPTAPRSGAVESDLPPLN